MITDTAYALSFIWHSIKMTFQATPSFNSSCNSQPLFFILKLALLQLFINNADPIQLNFYLLSMSYS